MEFCLWKEKNKLVICHKSKGIFIVWPETKKSLPRPHRRITHHFPLNTKPKTQAAAAELESINRTIF